MNRILSVGLLAALTLGVVTALGTTSAFAQNEEAGRTAGCDGNPHSGPTKDGGNPHHAPVDEGDPHFCVPNPGD